MNIATVFSGIGAIEHALERMDVDYNIVFASDNGGINLFEKRISISTSSIWEEMGYLKTNLFVIKNTTSSYFSSLIENKISHIELKYNDSIHKIEKFLLNDLEVKSIDHDIFKQLLSYKVKIPKSDKENQKKFQRLLRSIKDIIKQLNQLHYIIGVHNVKKTLATIESSKEKKYYVDNLYAECKKTNYVEKSYFANYNINKENFHYDINFIDGNIFKNKIDLFVGGSPCQSFSMVGKRQGLDDTRGTLFYDFARLISEIEPKVFIYENVKGLLTHDKGTTWDIMKRVFNELNYNWSYSTLNSKDFGIPQNRERLFVVGIRKDITPIINFSFPKPIPLKHTMKDFLLDSAPSKYYLPKKGVKFVTKKRNIEKRYTQVDGDIQLCQKANQQFNWHGDFVTENNTSFETEKLEKYFLSEKVRNYVLSSGTKNFYSKPKVDLDIARPLLTTMHKMHRSGIDNYVEKNGRLRKLTPRECLRLMGFSDSFKIVVSDTQMYRQAGNSIVVDVLINLLEKIFEAIPGLKE